MVKNSLANAGDTRDVASIPGLERSPGGGNGNSLQDSCLKNSMNREAWRATVRGITKSWTQLSVHTHALKEMQQVTEPHKQGKQLESSIKFKVSALQKAKSETVTQFVLSDILLLLLLLLLSRFSRVQLCATP